VSFSQVNTFNIELVFEDTIYHESISQMLEVDDGYIIAGSLYDAGAMMIGKIDFNGELLWKKKFGDPRYIYRPTSMIATSDSNFMLSTYYRDTLLYGYRSRMKLTKFDHDGDTLWTRLLYEPEEDHSCYPGNIVETYDGGFVICGGESLMGVVLKTDSLGILEWIKKLGSNHTTDCRGSSSVIQTKDSCFLVGGSFRNLHTGGSLSTLTKYDANGTTLWQRCFGGGQQDGHGTIVQPINDTSFVVLTSHTTEVNWLGNPTKRKIELVHIGIDGDVYYQNLVGRGTERYTVTDLEIYDDEMFIAILSPMYSEKTWLYCFSTTRDSIFFRKLVSPSEDKVNLGLSDVKRCQDGGIISCGNFREVINGYAIMNPWIIKTDPYGCLEPGCDRYVITFTEHPESAVECTDQFVELTVAGECESQSILYQWQILENGQWTGLNDTLSYQGIENDTLLIDLSRLTINTAYFRCKLYNNYWDFYSDSAKVEILDTISILSNPESISAAHGTDVEFNVSVTGYPPYEYIWYRNSSIIYDEYDSTLFIPNISIADTGLYQCIVSNSCGEQASNMASLTISDLGLSDERMNDLIRISPNPASQHIQIELDKTVKVRSLSIVSLIGTEHYRNTLLQCCKSKYNIEIGDFSPGIYILIITTEQNKYTKKILKF
jgi:hypothetical protein